MREGYTINGKELPSKADFTLGSGVESGWGKNVPEMEMKEMEEMTKIGTGYFLTTPVFDVDLFAKFLKQAQTFGVPNRGSHDIANRRDGPLSQSSS